MLYNKKKYFYFSLVIAFLAAVALMLSTFDVLNPTTRIIGFYLIGACLLVLSIYHYDEIRRVPKTFKTQQKMMAYAEIIGGGLIVVASSIYLITVLL